MNSRPSIAYRSTFLGVATMELVPLGHTRVISRSPRHGWVIVTNNCTCSRTNKFKPEMSFFVTTKCQTHVLLVINEIFKKKMSIKQSNHCIYHFICLWESFWNKLFQTCDLISLSNFDTIYSTCMSDSQRLIGPFWNLEVDFITGIQVWCNPWHSFPYLSNTHEQINALFVPSTMLFNL